MPHRSMSRWVLVVVALIVVGAGLLAAAPLKRGPIVAYARFEIASPLTSFDSVDIRAPHIDAERVIRTEAARMMDDETVDAVMKELRSGGMQVPSPGEFRAMLKADVVAGTSFVDMLVSAADAEDARAVASSWSDVYTDRLRTHMHKVLRDRIQNLEGIVRDLTTDIEQIDARTELLLAKERVTSLELGPDDPTVIEVTLIKQRLLAAREEQQRMIPAGMDAETAAAKQAIIADLEVRESYLVQVLESRTAALKQIAHWDQERAEKFRKRMELGDDVVRLRLHEAATESFYPSVRQIIKPRLRTPAG